MDIRFSPGINEYSKLSTDELRKSFLVETLFQPGKLELLYTDLDRAVVGSAVPTNTALKLRADPELRASFFCERRELGILNVGGTGKVEVDGKSFTLGKLDCLYVGRGSRDVIFYSDDPAQPAAYYLLSYPAHADYPTTVARQSEHMTVDLGTVADANERRIHKCIHMEGIRSCQLVMGYTILKEGSVWNTMPPHTHARRSEIYFYFDMGSRRVMHLMGTPQQTRHLIMSDRQVVLSPIWSIHCGCGTGAYTFCWGMGGENQAYNDMDPAPLAELR